MCEWELYRPSSTPETAYRVLGGMHGDEEAVRRIGTTTRLHTRLPAALSDELGGLSTSLGLFASPPLILSTESVVVRHGVEGHKHVDCNAVYRSGARCLARARNRHCSGP